MQIRPAKTFLYFAVFISLILSPVASSPWAQTPTIEACFTPGENCTEKIVKALGQGHLSVFVQAYSFTSGPIAKALVDAHKRGVQVEVILDRSQQREKYSSADFIAHAGIPTYIDSQHSIAHNKVIVIDGQIVITGSFNFTKAAQEKNAENLIVIHDRILANRYLTNWEFHRKHSNIYRGK